MEAIGRRTGVQFRGGDATGDSDTHPMRDDCAQSIQTLSAVLPYWRKTRLTLRNSNYP